MARVGVVVALAFAAVLLVSGAPHAREGAPRPTSTDLATPPLATDLRPVPSGATTVPLPSSTLLRLTVSLHPAHEGRLDALVRAVDDPSSPNYRAFLSATAFEAQFAPGPRAVDAVERSLWESGARSVAVAPGRFALVAILDAGGVDRWLGVVPVAVTLGSGLPAGYTSIGAPRPPPDVASLIDGVGGLARTIPIEYRTAAGPSEPPLERSGSPAPQFVRSNSSSDNWFVGSDYAQAYRATALWPGNGSVVGATYPTGLAIATLLASGYNTTSQTDLPPWDPKVVRQYFLDTLGPTWPTPKLNGVVVSLAGVSDPPPPGSFGTLNDSTGDEAENSLDLEMAGSLAPGASLYNFYFSGSVLENPTILGSIADDFANELGAALSHNYSPDHLAVVSISFGLSDQNDSLWNLYLEEAAVRGVTVVAASGDQGDAPDVATGGTNGPWPIWPASAAYNDSGAVTAGGVTVGLTGSPTSTFNGVVLNATFDPTVTAVANQTAWFDTSRFGRWGGTEGGASWVYPEPYWQFHSAAQPAIVNATVSEGNPSLGRAGPDVAFPANRTIVYDWASGNGTVFAGLFGGTSIAAPVFAGLLTDIVAVESANAARFSPLGFLSPELYRIASYYDAAPGPTDPFLDVTNGSNYVFAATAGWDAATGWGGVVAPRLLAADLNATVSGYRYTGPTPGLPPVASAPGLPEPIVLGILAAAVAVAVILIAVFARPSRATGGPPSALSDPDAPFAAPPATSGATFPCPYCGSSRPAEPVRCPQCGAL